MTLLAYVTDVEQLLNVKEILSCCSPDIFNMTLFL